MRALRGLDNCSRGSASCRRVPRCVRPLHHFSGQPRRSTSLQQHLLNYSRVDFLQALSNPQCVPAAGTLQARCRHALSCITHSESCVSTVTGSAAVLSLALQFPTSALKQCSTGSKKCCCNHCPGRRVHAVICAERVLAGTMHAVYVYTTSGKANNYHITTLAIADHQHRDVATYMQPCHQHSGT